MIRLAKTIFVLFAFSICGSYAYSQVSQSKIACIGNSITAGARLAEPSEYSYPAVLSKLLTNNGFAGYQVHNFGIGGATMLRYGTPNLWGLLDSLKMYKPDIVIIKAGTNETVSKPRYNWEHIEKFEEDYMAFLDSIRVINSKCVIVLCSPLDMVLNTPELSTERMEDLAVRRPRIWILRETISKISKAEKSYFLDLTQPFSDKPELMTSKDGVHPNQAGYAYLAKQVFDFLVKNDIVLK